MNLPKPILQKYKPLMYILQGKAIDLNQAQSIEVVQKFEVTTRLKEVKKRWLFPDEVNYELVRLPTDKYYVWLRAINNIYNEQIYFDSKKEADRFMKKLIHIINRG